MIKNKPVIGILPTYNLVNDANDPYQDRASFVRMYEEKIYECGGIPIGLLHQNMYDYLPLCDGYLWPGGSKVWPDFFLVLEDALKYKKPVLGVCLGLQAIGTFFNLKEAKEKHPEKSLEEVKQFLKDTDHYLKQLEDASLHNHYVTKDVETQEAARHLIQLKKDTLFYEIMGQEKVNVVSLHSFILPYASHDVTVSATSEDGVIEAIEYIKDGAQILGVQYHPELESSSELFSWLVDASYQKTMFLVNKQNPIPDSYSPNISLYQSEYPRCGEESNLSESVMYSGVQVRDFMWSRGFYIDVESAYRRTEMQRQIYEDNRAKYGEEHASIFVARPGYSEHETGLAIDVCMKIGEEWINEFDERLHACYQLLHQVCANYGFILRYPKGKEEITGYHYEPWHLRYLGSSRIASDIMKRKLTLEEYYQERFKNI